MPLQSITPRFPFLQSFMEGSFPADTPEFSKTMAISNLNATDISAVVFFQKVITYSLRKPNF
jgi:hypothetical protein